ncbi:hypothetical protein MKX01_015193 [Papaver californicum]|nr:hypothetical protein MKX01_015193 [Papaver californicum]
MNGVVSMTTTSQAYLQGKQVTESRSLVAELCRHFYTLGWVSGTGGSMTLKVHDESIPKPQQNIYFHQLVRFSPFFKPCPQKPPKCTDCAPLFMKVYYSYGDDKGIQGHGYHDDLVVPIVENTAHEGELTDSLAEAIKAYPKTTAVLVRNHGIYIWGDSWINAKTQAECYHYLFEAAIKLYQLGLNWSTPTHMPIQSVNKLCDVDSNVKTRATTGGNGADPSRRCVVLDIEGTATPITFITEVLFPYARDSVRKHLTATYDTQQTKDDIKLLHAQVENDVKQGVVGVLPIASEEAGKEEVIDSLVANVEAMIKADRKITSLKELQGHIWRTGFENNELKGVVFEDVPQALERWMDSGIRVYIYSSGSREAQRLLFGLEVIISVRPGNAPLPETQEFKTVTSFSEI